MYTFIYPGITLIVDGVSDTVELHEIAVIVGVKAADVDASAVAVR